MPAASGLSAAAFNCCSLSALGFSLSRIAVISVIVRGGATNPAGSVFAADITGVMTSLGRSMATFARPLAEFSAARTQARTDGEALALHDARFASLPGAFLPPNAILQKKKIA